MRRPNPDAIGLGWVLLGAVAVVFCAQWARAADPTDPLDLNIPAARIGKWWDPKPVEDAYLAAQTWQEYDATCNSAPCATSTTTGLVTLPYTDLGAISGCPIVTTTSVGGLDCMLDASSGLDVVIYLPAGTYEHTSPQWLQAGDVVLRGAGHSTILMAMQNTYSTAPACVLGNSGASLLSVCGTSLTGTAAQDWTAGYAIGDTVLTVADTTDFTIGRWVMARQDTLDLGCEFVREGDSAANDMATHWAKVTARSVASGAGTITIDRPLVFDYAQPGCEYPGGGHSIRPMSPIERVGIENIRLTTDPAVALCSLDQLAGGGCPNHSTSWMRWRVAGVSNTVESWFVGVRMDRVYEDFLNIRYAARLWFASGMVENGGLNSDNLSGGNRVRNSSDVVFENYICDGAKVCFQAEQSSEGLVVAYSYFDVEKIKAEDNCVGITGYPCEHEKAIFNHGRGARSTLAEGNDLDGRITLIDRYWDQNGPFHAAYRNRNRLDGSAAGHCAASNTGLIVYDKEGSGERPAEYASVIGNTVLAYAARASIGADCPGINPAEGFNGNAPHLWMEKNAWRANNFTQVDGACGSGEGFCSFYVLDTTDAYGNNATTSFGTSEGDAYPGTNEYTFEPVSPWDTESYPVSLYRSEAPSWWCQEACDWDDKGIGAFGDDFGGTLCKLPAQIRFESGTCTPLAAPPVDPPVDPPAPSSPVTGSGGGGSGSSWPIPGLQRRSL